MDNLIMNKLISQKYKLFVIVTFWRKGNLYMLSYYRNVNEKKKIKLLDVNLHMRWT